MYTPRQKSFLTAFSIVGQGHPYCSHKPIIRPLISEDEYQRLDPDTLAKHITQFTLRALGAKKNEPRLTEAQRKTQKKKIEKTGYSTNAWISFDFFLSVFFSVFSVTLWFVERGP